MPSIDKASALCIRLCELRASDKRSLNAVALILCDLTLISKVA